MLALSGACSRPEVLTPEAAKARGDAMLRQMSDSLAKAQTFSYQADQAIDRIGAGGARTTQRFSRNTIVRRPNQADLQRRRRSDRAPPGTTASS